MDFVALTFVNGEVGLINPVYQLAELIKSRQSNCHVHVDAVQALGKIDLTGLHASKVDSAAFSAHKIGGLKGVGCLYTKDLLKEKLKPMIYGGSQEFSLRSGTENLAGIISFAVVCKSSDPKEYSKTLLPLKNQLLEFLNSHSEKIIVNSSPEKSVCNTVNFHLKKDSSAKDSFTF